MQKKKAKTNDEKAHHQSGFLSSCEVQIFGINLVLLATTISSIDSTKRLRSLKFSRDIDDKMMLGEVGPYIYQVLLESHNATFHGNNTVDKIIAPNIPYLGATLVASSCSMITDMTLKVLANKLQLKPMLGITMDDELWVYDDRLMHLASELIPQIINFEKFGLLGHMFYGARNVVNMHLPGSKISNDRQPNYYTENET
uniref:Uncharacterized protein n=1 Tax=Glossina palpalis gambiensis TaxID=67801 RepID=A0A1B0B413_9MUSC